MTVPTTRTPCGPSLWHQDEFTLALLTGFPEASQWSSAHEKHPLPPGDSRVCWARCPDPLSLRVPFREVGRGLQQEEEAAHQGPGPTEARYGARPDSIVAVLCGAECGRPQDLVASARSLWAHTRQAIRVALCTGLNLTAPRNWTTTPISPEGNGGSERSELPS